MAWPHNIFLDHGKRIERLNIFDDMLRETIRREKAIHDIASIYRLREFFDCEITYDCFPVLGKYGLIYKVIIIGIDVEHKKRLISKYKNNEANN